MTKKDYIAIAAILKSATCHTSGNDMDDKTAEYMRGSIVEDFARMLANDNPRFDRERFLKACGVN